MGLYRGRIFWRRGRFCDNLLLLQSQQIQVHRIQVYKRTGCHKDKQK